MTLSTIFNFPRKGNGERKFDTSPMTLDSPTRRRLLGKVRQAQS